jgi:hypothetical protein
VRKEAAEKAFKKMRAKERKGKERRISEEG